MEVIVLWLVMTAAVAAAGPAEATPARAAAEARIVAYLRSHVQPGRPVVVSQLYNEVFTTPDERAVLDRLFDTFFRIPLFLAQQQTAGGKPPTLAQVAEQFGFAVPGEADVMLQILEADPRLPGFIERDAATGEITRVDVAAVLAHPRFGRSVERTIAGWEGRTAPGFSVTRADGSRLDSDSLTGRAHLVYFWFSGCPPCTRTAPLLAELRRQLAGSGFEVVALNADDVLEVPVGAPERAAYEAKNGWTFPSGAASREVIDAYGSVGVFPTFFFVDRRGVIVRQLVNYQPLEALDAAARRALE